MADLWAYVTQAGLSAVAGAAAWVAARRDPGEAVTATKAFARPEQLAALREEIDARTRALVAREIESVRNDLEQLREDIHEAEEREASRLEAGAARDVATARELGGIQARISTALDRIELATQRRRRDPP